MRRQADVSRLGPGQELCEINGLESLQILRELEGANLRFGVFRQAMQTLLPWCRAIAQVRGGVEIVDLGCGTGGLLRHLTRRLAGEGISYKALGLDLNPLAIREAQAVAALEQGRPGGGELTFATGGIEALRSRRVDLVVGTFLLHHLDLVQLRELFEVLNDSVGFAVYQLDFRPDGPAWMRALWQGALALFGYSRQTRADGLISIGRSRPAEVLVEVGRSCGLRFETKTCLGLCLEVLGVRSDHFAAFSIHARS